MFSNDKNVETIGQLVETIKHYIGLQKEYLKLDVVDKVVRLLTAFTITLVLVGLLTTSSSTCRLLRLSPWATGWEWYGDFASWQLLHSPLALIRCQQAPMDRETFCQISCQPTPEIALSLMVNS